MAPTSEVIAAPSWPVAKASGMQGGLPGPGPRGFTFSPPKCILSMVISSLNTVQALELRHAGGQPGEGFDEACEASQAALVPPLP